MFSKIKAYFVFKSTLQKGLDETCNSCRILERENTSKMYEIGRWQNKNNETENELYRCNVLLADWCKKYEEFPPCNPHDIKYNPDDRSYHCYKCFKKFEDKIDVA